MNTNKTSKKLNKFSTTPIIGIVAILEVIILICVSTFAWLVYAENNRVSTDYISVEPDSGLEIDFNEANDSDYVNIWNYLEEFTFEPVTSIDGRNIFVPTTGTFNSTDTTNMVFREATVNDMNSKYINIDFSLTNTGVEDMEVSLSSKSYFKFNNSANGKALRLAFYQNDGSKGLVSSSLLSNDHSDTSSKTVYFYNTLGWEQPYAHIWKDGPTDADDEPLIEWPGVPMTKIAGNIYYFTFDKEYDSIIFNNGSSGQNIPQTEDLSPTTGNAIQNGYIYTIGDAISTYEYECSADDYQGIVTAGTYPVISPGVSTGFQRPYAPVVALDNTTGNATSIVPAFASSIDDYNYGSKELFTIKAGQTMSLSMIVWLEGTDPDCSGDIYAGKDIDMNLVFATSGTGGDETYTYKFLDKTKENWIKSKITTETGVSFDPVIQLYDADNYKGYLMRLSEDGVTWTAQAPKDLINSDHILFRRVNPMNEDEVWNYWETNGFGSLSSSVLSQTVINDVVYFTAFADGSPTNIPASASPSISNGGMWGNHETKTLTFVDGTSGQWLGNDKSAITINYTYNGQTLEYKGSGSGHGTYYFVVPECICNTTSTIRPNIKFKRFYEFNDKYAINAQEYQPDLKYDRTFDAGVLNGLFCEVNQSPGDEYSTVWGSDLLVIQSASAINSKFDTGVWQVKFYTSPDADATTTGAHKYLYLYKNNFYNDGAGGYGYCCVVPSDSPYYYYKVERVNSTDTSERWNTTDVIAINADTAATAGMHNNTISKNICKITHLEHTLYYQMSTSYCSSTNRPALYAWKDGGGSNGTWPGVTMTYVSNVGSGSLNKYKATVNITDYDQAIFSVEVPSFYIDTNNNNVNWNSDGAWFAAYIWGNSGSTWVKGISVSDDDYAFPIPAGSWDGVKFCRMNPASSAFGFDNAWNQSTDMDMPTADKIAYIERWDSFGTTWGTYSGTGKARIQSQDKKCYIGGDGDRNGMIIEGNVSGSTINITKLYGNDGKVLVEEGVDPALSLKCEFYDDSTKFE